MAANNMKNRNILLVPVLETEQHDKIPLNMPHANLSAKELNSLRKHFKIAPGSFQVILLGEDGGSKLSSRAPVSMDQLSSLIDAMPTRRRELRQPPN